LEDKEVLVAAGVEVAEGFTFIGLIFQLEMNTSL
jgi:hypothetical protein